jgi:hypothetical protein
MFKQPHKDTSQKNKTKFEAKLEQSWNKVKTKLRLEIFAPHFAFLPFIFFPFP